jgi:hypothetical protein
MSERSRKRGTAKLVEKRDRLKELLWGEDLKELKLWNRKEQDGWTTLPRTMPQICRIIDKLSGSGTPVSSTYLSLWCNVFDEGVLEIKDPMRFAFESGFSGNRAITTWISRMRKLESLGFISSRKGTSEFSYVLILNPFPVIQELYSESGQCKKDKLYNALVIRMLDVGAKFDD